METYGLEKLGIINAGAVYRNLTPAQLVEHALRRGEGTLSNTGALVVKTGKYTGRSANDKFIVDTPAVHDDIAEHQPVNDGVHGLKMFRILREPDVSGLVLRVFQRSQPRSGKELQGCGNSKLHKHVPCGKYLKDAAKIVKWL